MTKVEPNQQPGTECTLFDAGQASALHRRIANISGAGRLKRSVSSYGANYLAACQTNTENDFINKLSLLAADWSETLQELDRLSEINPEFAEKIDDLRQEGNELFLTIASSVDFLKRD